MAYGLSSHVAAIPALAIAVAGACTLATEVQAGPTAQAKHYDPLPR